MPFPAFAGMKKGKSYKMEPITKKEEKSICCSLFSHYFFSPSSFSSSQERNSAKQAKPFTEKSSRRGSEDSSCTFKNTHFRSSRHCLGHGVMLGFFPLHVIVQPLPVRRALPPSPPPLLLAALSDRTVSLNTSSECGQILCSSWHHHEV